MKEVISMDEIVKLDIRLTKDLKERFRAACEAESVNGSALIRKWIEEYVAEKEKPLISMDLLDIVWKLSKSSNIKETCAKAANLLGYDNAAGELWSDVTDMLINRTKALGKYALVDGFHYGQVKLNNDEIYFSLNDDDGTWSTDAPDWIDKIQL